MLDLFADETPWAEPLAPGAKVIRRLAREKSAELLGAIEQIAAVSPFRQMVTPGGFTMSVAMTNCGPLGWSTDRHGYCYTSVDPLTGKAWPQMPDCFRTLVQEAAALAGYPAFQPDACLVNRYQPGAKLSLHQDKDEACLDAPIVSVSLGLPATFQFGGLQRSDPLQKVWLEHGDVVVWGGESRLFYHAILPLKAGSHPQVGPWRYNLTFRRATE